jgi:imidazolonepropionase-like amidohydrolase
MPIFDVLTPHLMLRFRLPAFLFALWCSCLQAQTTFPLNGIPDPRTGWYAFTRATIHISAEEVLEDATLIIREGRIQAVGSGLTIPTGAVEVDLQDRHIYPAFLEIYGAYGIPAERENRETSDIPWYERRAVWGPTRGGPVGWNDALRTEMRHAHTFTPSEKEAGSLRKGGFAAVNTHHMDGISRGVSALVSLGDRKPHDEIIRAEAAHHLSFKKGSSKTSYPGSLMGCIALLRQTYMDAAWYQNYKEEHNIQLEAWNRVQHLPQIFDVRDWQEALRAQAIAREFGVRYIYKGSGDEYRRLDALKATGATFILPLQFPKPFKVESPYDVPQLNLRDLKHWEWAPANPGALERAGMSFVLTAHGLDKPEAIFGAVRTAIEHGLSPGQALEALTRGPAKLLGVDAELGTLHKGKRAHFLITSGPVFEEGTQLFETWIDGRPYVIKAAGEPDLSGKYELRAGERIWRMEVRGGADKNNITLHPDDSTKVKVQKTWDRDRIHLRFAMPGENEGDWWLSGFIDEEQWGGRGTDPAGQWVSWSALKRDTLSPEKSPEKSVENPFHPDSLGPITYPLLAYGFVERPRSESWLIRNATLWTNEVEGILEGADILIENGRITRIGQNLAPGNARVIDARGKHVTSGIIDEHSHIAISRGVNECTGENTAEVRIGDVINSEDINIYRQLSGGVVAAQLLHGSCNPIGGQSAIIKLRWGATPEEMKMTSAPGFIKFALGENVKRGNASSNSRYPDSRMGVEQVYINAFTRAREYEKRKQDPEWKTRLRPDLQLEAVLEILRGQRFISCHSYVQSEINMLMHVADSFGFRVNTFTHILEGYKVADKMARHGAGGSAFADWWAYKFEVYDAIPYNGALMHRQGVLTAYNSDDAEMARRLNQEAAKAVRYGGVSEEEAWKFVTLNPARLLHIDDRTGSLKPGKDADVVIWSDHPLSIYAVAEKTFVDGLLLFDRERDRELREEVRVEKQRILEKMKQKGGDKSGRPVKPSHEHHYHCDTVEDEIID